MDEPRSRFEFDVSMAHAIELSELAASDPRQFELMARRYRAAMLKRCALIAPILALAGMGATTLWPAAVAAGSVQYPFGAALGLGVAALYAAWLASLDPYIRRLRREYRNLHLEQCLFLLVGHWSVEVHEDGVQFHSARSVSKTFWPSVGEVRLSEHGVSIDAPDFATLLIPMRAFRDMDAASATAEMIRKLRSNHPDFRNNELGDMLTQEDVRCGYCRYPLAGCEQRRCPECGGSVVASVAAHHFKAPRLDPYAMDEAGL